jgi:hypothetical protein
MRLRAVCDLSKLVGGGNVSVVTALSTASD